MTTRAFDPAVGFESPAVLGQTSDAVAPAPAPVAPAPAPVAPAPVAPATSVVGKVSKTVGDMAKTGVKTVGNAAAAVGHVTNKGLNTVGIKTKAGPMAKKSLFSVFTSAVGDTTKKNIKHVGKAASAVGKVAKKGLNTVGNTVKKGAKAVGLTAEKAAKETAGVYVRHKKRQFGRYLIGIGIVMIIFAILYIAVTIRGSSSLGVKAFGWIVFLGGAAATIYGVKSVKKNAKIL